MSTDARRQLKEMSEQIAAAIPQASPSGLNLDALSVAELRRYRELELFGCGLPRTRRLTPQYCDESDAEIIYGNMSDPEKKALKFDVARLSTAELLEVEAFCNKCLAKIERPSNE
jgi:hypothetical protein